MPYTFGIKRTPHIHFIVKKGEKRMLTTQVYVKGHPLNEQDFVFQGIPSVSRGSVLVDFKPIMDSRIGELAAHFDIVIGNTPEDPSKDRFQGSGGRSLFGGGR